MKLMLFPVLLLAVSIAWAQNQGNRPGGNGTQMTDQTNAYPAQDKTPGSRASRSQSTIEGCLVGSGDRYVLTDMHQGTIYLLSGNDSLLKGHVGQQVAMTGVAGNIEPSNRPGQPGYINPNQPDTSGEAGTREGSKTKTFQVQYVQKEAGQCQNTSASQANAIAASNASLGSVANNSNATEPQTGYTAGGDNGLQGCLSGGPGNYMLSQPALRRHYQVEGNDSQLQAQVGHTVRLTGHLQPGESPVFQADGVQQLAASCNYQTNESPQATSGKTGNSQDEVPVTTTASAGTPTPGYQTQAGQAQQPGSATGLNAGGATPPPDNTEKNGAPVPNEQIGQDRASAERISNAAHMGEVGGYESGNYGLNGNAPNYSQAKGQPPASQSGQENNAPGSATVNTQNQKGQGSEGGMAPNRDAKPNRTTLTGCLKGSKNGHEFTLATKDGRHVSLQSTQEDLKNHLNHTVQIIGEQGNFSPQHSGIAGRNGGGMFLVDGVNDLAPTCSGSGK